MTPNSPDLPYKTTKTTPLRVSIDRNYRGYDETVYFFRQPNQKYEANLNFLSSDSRLELDFFYVNTFRNFRRDDET